MLKLYYSPGACSLSPHVALREAEIPFQLERVDFAAGKKLQDGRTFTAISPKGYVPALVLPDGQLLTEGAVMVQYIADLKPASRLLAPWGTPERLRTQEWLHYIATELHKGMSALLAAEAPAAYKEKLKDGLSTRMEFLDKSVGKNAFVMGDDFTVVDGYLVYVFRAWDRRVARDLPEGLSSLRGRIFARPSVRAALEAEGIS